jgi:hypothetical protein
MSELPSGAGKISRINLIMLRVARRRGEQPHLPQLRLLCRRSRIYKGHPHVRMVFPPTFLYGINSLVSSPAALAHQPLIPLSGVNPLRADPPLPWVPPLCPHTCRHFSPDRRTASCHPSPPPPWQLVHCRPTVVFLLSSPAPLST